MPLSGRKVRDSEGERREERGERRENNGEFNGHLRLPPPACAKQPLAHALRETNNMFSGHPRRCTVGMSEKTKCCIQHHNYEIRNTNRNKSKCRYSIYTSHGLHCLVWFRIENQILLPSNRVYKVKTPYFALKVGYY